MAKIKKKWKLFEGRRSYTNKKGVYVNPEIAELQKYNKKRLRNLK